MPEGIRRTEPKRHIPDRPIKPVHPKIIQDQKDAPDRIDRRPHIPSPEPPMPYWPDEDKPRHQPDADENGVAEVDYKL